MTSSCFGKHKQIPIRIDLGISISMVVAEKLFQI